MTDLDFLTDRADHIRLIARECIHVPKGGQRFTYDSSKPRAFPLALERLSQWMPDPDAPHAYMRIVEGGDPNKVEDRRCFIEKTPRVYDPTLGMPPTDWRSWVPSDKGCGQECGQYGPSRAWADAFAVKLGYVLPEPPHET